jgi:hypothetical protein
MKKRNNKHQGLVAVTGMSTAMLAIMTAGMAVHEGLFGGNPSDLSTGSLIAICTVCIAFIIIPTVLERRGRK